MNAEQKLITLRMQRDDLAAKVKAGRSGVVELRKRLEISTHRVMAFELFMAKQESENT